MVANRREQPSAVEVETQGNLSIHSGNLTFCGKQQSAECSIDDAQAKKHIDRNSSSYSHHSNSHRSNSITANNRYSFYTDSAGTQNTQSSTSHTDRSTNNSSNNNTTNNTNNNTTNNGSRKSSNGNMTDANHEGNTLHSMASSSREQHFDELSWGGCSAAPIGSRRSTQLLHAAMARWQNEAEQRQAILQELEVKFASAAAAADERSLRAVLRGAVAALTAPRSRVLESGSGQPLGEEAQERLARAWQRRLRELVLGCLSKLDTSDARSAPALAVLQSLIARFESRTGTDASEACAGKTWQKLKAAVAPEGVHESGVLRQEAVAEEPDLALPGLESSAPVGLKRPPWSQEELQSLRDTVADRGGGAAMTLRLWRRVASQLGRTTHSCRARFRLMTDPRYFPAAPQVVKHPTGLIKNVIFAALAKLHGQATLPELLRCIRADAAIQRDFAGSFSNHVSKVTGTISCIPATERSIKTNISRHCRATMAKRSNFKIYVLK
ncbi:unnamed protein product [Polarella glacialis]|uniref:Myb-like domain-containing protein n=1 Tax=Polarella glacialis TaxID=89957 RepID=A0A813HYM3_POLGL|nr:unnamed protein product [Polarella glacialis]